jgi:flagellar hook-associated protein 1 FlgK
MRDQVLTQAQSQLDAFAAAIASALSDTTTPGTPATSGANTGFDVDASTLAADDSIDIAYVDPATGATKRMSFVAVGDPAAAGPTSDPGVYGIDISGGPAAIVAQMNAALAGTGVNVTNPAGGTVRVLANPATAQVTSAGVTTTTGAIAGSVKLPLFSDGATPYTGAVTTAGLQSQGLAARLVVNPGLVADPSKLVAYQSGTAAADATRPNFIYDQMAGASLACSPTTGIGSSTAPFSGTLGTYLSQMLSLQAEQASNAQQLSQGQDVVVNALQQRFTDGSSVNIDQEMANLLNLQNAYAANARVMSAVRDMLQSLLQLT